MDITLKDFYNKNKCNQFFNEDTYLEQYPEVADFYQPYCKEHSVTEKERLYFHWVCYGINMGMLPCKTTDIHKFLAFLFEEIAYAHRQKERLLKMIVNFIRTTTYNPHVCDSNEDGDFNINLVKSVAFNLDIEKRIQEHDFND